MSWHIFATVVGGVVGILSLCAAIAIGLRRQEQRYEVESGQSIAGLKVVAPSRHPAPLPRQPLSGQPLSGQAIPGQRRPRQSRPRQSRPRQSRRRRRSQPELLPPHSTVNFADERKAADIDGVLAALDHDLVGLVPVKRKVEEIASLLLVDRARNRFGLTAPKPNLHMCFTGPPGTGKTTMALRMADLLHRLGYLEQGQLVHAMRDDLVGQYVGQTAPKTRRVLDKAMGGVLFIDEAYYLYRAADSKDFGQEVIDILLQVMENQRESLVVVLAGYKDRMEEFFGVNPGMRSRIAHHLDFAPYDLGELVSIGRLMLDEANYHLSPMAEVAFRDEVARQMAQPGFANARSVRNDLDRSRLRHAHRLAADISRHWSRDELMRLEEEDILEVDFAGQAFGLPAGIDGTDARDIGSGDVGISQGRHSR